MNYVFDGISLKNGRKSNMDSLLLKLKLINGENALLAVVCDGVGSFVHGNFASGVVAKMLSDWFENVVTTDYIGIKMREAILNINSSIVEEAKQNNIKTATTLSALLLIENKYFIVHIGDSRVYSYSNEILEILTNDDVSESGKLTSYIGYDKNIFLQYYEGVVLGKSFLICSDGLYKKMDINFLKEKFKNLNKNILKELIYDLQEYVVSKGEQDNISFALIKIED